MQKLTKAKSRRMIYGPSSWDPKGNEETLRVLRSGQVGSDLPFGKLH